MDNLKIGQILVGIGVAASLISVAMIGGEVAITTVAFGLLATGVYFVRKSKEEKGNA